MSCSVNMKTPDCEEKDIIRNRNVTLLAALYMMEKASCANT